MSKSILVMAPGELLKHIKRLAGGAGRVILTAHTKWERMPERSIIEADICRLLRTGSMTRPAEPGIVPNELKCRVNGKDIDGRKIGIEIAVSDDHPNMIVVTVIRY